jgi:serine---pyruvate transaminase
VLVTHNETSTGVTNDVQALAAATRAVGTPSPLLIVDAISSLGAIDLPADTWGCDIVVTCSQKALMSPPGISMLSVSPRAWDVVEATPRRSYYFDLRALRKTAKDGETPATPPVSDLFALREGVSLLLAEGLPNSFARHQRVGAKMRAGVVALGLELLADPLRASDTVTAINMPDSLPADAIRTKVREEYGIVLAGGQGSLKGRIVRVGHMGYVTESDVEAVVSAIRAVIQTYGAV